MKNKVIIILLMIAGIFTSCTDNTYEAPPAFSDVGWYTSAFQQENFVVAKGQFASFTDASVGTLDHTWTIEEGNSFLKGPIALKETKFDSYIIYPGAVETTDKTIHVYFKNEGFQKVRLYNTFNDYVAYRYKTFAIAAKAAVVAKAAVPATGDAPAVPAVAAAPAVVAVPRMDAVLPAVKVGDKWVIDYTFNVKVVDTIVAKMQVTQTVAGVTTTVSHQNATDVITIKKGTRLQFIDLTEKGDPTTRTWKIGAATLTLNNTAAIPNNNNGLLIFNTVGDFKGTFTASRASTAAGALPNDTDIYNIPATFRVVP
ncbi:hypothetical protein [Flavobacterium ovatum]|uniref:hypothetical protein n=1 Tax=Flavobacterium ovatum TaxID=1928857 RepID=UPI00344E1F17